MNSLPERPADVSIILPTFGRPEFLERAIRSVRHQTFTDWVLLVVNDNEPTSEARRETAAAMQAFADDARVRYHRQERNLGACVARNTGAAQADSEFLAFLDDDDEWLPTKLQRQLELFVNAEPEVALVYTGFRRLYDGRFPDVDVVPRLQGNVLFELLRENVIGTTSSIVVRRAAFEAVGGFNADYPASQDYDLYLRIARKYAIAGVPEVLTLSHRHGEGNISRDTDAKLKAFELMLEHNADLFESAPEAQMLHVRRIVTRLVHRGRGQDARRVLRMAQRSGPMDLRSAALWALSFWPSAITRRAAAFKTRTLSRLRSDSGG